MAKKQAAKTAPSTSNKKNVQARQRSRKGVQGYEYLASSHVARDLDATQIGRYSERNGHGLAAEDANTQADRYAGRTAETVGTNNATDGPDRLVDGKFIQSKYCKSAEKSVDAAFEDGVYRYGDMQLEVPSDQYEKAVEIMRQRIADGKVPGVVDPKEAENLVRKGNISYDQARKIAELGTVEGLKYDARNGIVTAAIAASISFLVMFAKAKWDGASTADALKAASIASIKSGSIAFIVSVGSAQLHRTVTAREMKVSSRRVIQVLRGTAAGRFLVKNLGLATTGTVRNIGPVINGAAKLLRSNVITGAVTLTVVTLPDVYRAAISRNTSWAQVAKNATVSASAIAGGSLGALGGASLGAFVGSVVPVIGTVAGGVVGGVLGSLGAGAGVSTGAKALLDKFVDDDAKNMLAIANKVLVQNGVAYLMSESEFMELVERARKLLGPNLLLEMYASQNPKKFAEDRIEPLAKEVVQKRARVECPTDQQVQDAIAELLREAEQQAKERIDQRAARSAAAAAIEKKPTAPVFRAASA